jgi:hypothetical protein
MEFLQLLQIGRSLVASKAQASLYGARKVALGKCERSTPFSRRFCSVARPRLSGTHRCCYSARKLWSAAPGVNPV